MRRILLATVFVAVAAVGARAAEGDNAGLLPAEKGGAPSGAPSYYEGTWVGGWPAWLGPGTTQDVTMKIERGAREGVFRVEYSWGATTLHRGTIPPGSVRTRGREENDHFVFKWTNKRGNDVEITLRKQADDTVKARLEKSGPLGPGERPDSETTLKRK